MEQSPSAVEVPALRYRPGIYTCVAVETHLLDDIAAKLDTADWFRHDPSVHPAVDAAEQRMSNETWIWMHAGNGRAMAWAHECTSICFYLYGEQDHEEPLFRSTSNHLFVEDTGKAWSAKYTEKMMRLQRGEAIRVSGDEMSFEPDGAWEAADFHVTNPDERAVRREIEEEGKRLERAVDDVANKEQNLIFARKHLEETRHSTAERIKALMRYLEKQPG